MYLYAGGMAEGLKSWFWADDTEDRESGASALEWAIIAAISVVMATVIGTVIYNVVNTKSQDIQRCGSVAVGSNCAGGPAAPAGG
jgi:Flp pilus assembly pilin Flp